jgi:hypothetical protein
VISYETDIDEIKRQLSLKQDFNLHDAFRLFDRTGKGYASAKRIRKGLKKSFGVKISEEQVSSLINKFSRGELQGLKYSEFCDIVMPYSFEYAAMLSRRLPITNSQIMVDKNGYTKKYPSKVSPY